MGRSGRSHSREFKIEAVKQVVEKGARAKTVRFRVTLPARCHLSGARRARVSAGAVVGVRCETMRTVEACAQAASAPALGAYSLRNDR